jgi:ankyrin repeat protein
MSFRCKACSDKTYDKAWKLKRHIRESKQCFEQINPGIPANHLTQYQCTSCSYTSPREPDLERHCRLRFHGEFANPTASGHVSTSSADAAMEGSARVVDTTITSELLRPESLHERQSQLFQSNPEHTSSDLGDTQTCDPSTSSVTSSVPFSTSSLQTITPPTTNEGSGNTERLGTHFSSSSQKPVAKRKCPGRDRLYMGYKRLCTGLDSIGLKIMSTNETDMINEHDPEHDPEHDLEPEVVQDNLTYQVSPALFGVGGWIDPSYDYSLVKCSCADPPIADELAAELADAIANIDLTSFLRDHKTSATQGDWLDFRFPRDETQTLSSSSGSRNFSRIESNPAMSIPASEPERKSTGTSSVAISQSIDSKGSLFGRPSIHTHKPWMTSSSGAPARTSAANSLHSTDMPAPMLTSMCEELSLSRAWTSEERPRSYSSFHLTPQEQFGLAAADDDVERLRLSIEDLAFDCSHRDHEGRTALIWAAERGHCQAVKVLLSDSSSGGVDVNSRDNRGMTAIMFACQRGDLNICRSLLSLPAIDLWAQSKAGPTALMMAIQTTKINAGPTTLTMAIQTTKTDHFVTNMVGELVAYVQTQTDYHTAVAKWHPFFNAQDARGLTSFHWALKLGRFDCISTLLDTERVDVNMKASRGITPVMQAVEDVVKPDILRFLFDRKACDPTVANESGETLPGVSRRVMQESWKMLVDYKDRSVPGVKSQLASDRLRIWRRLQMARENMRLCVAYAYHWTKDQARESSDSM